MLPAAVTSPAGSPAQEEPGRYREQAPNLPRTTPVPDTEPARRLISAWGAAQDTDKAAELARGRRTLDHFLRDYFGTSHWSRAARATCGPLSYLSPAPPSPLTSIITLIAHH